MLMQTLDVYIQDTAALFSLVADRRWAQFLDSGFQQNKEAFEKKQQSIAVSSATIDVLVHSPKSNLITKAGTTWIKTGKESITRSAENPFRLLAEAIKPYRANADQFNQHLDEQGAGHRGLPFYGGAIGYFGYELGRRVEQLPMTAVDDVALPDMAVGIYEVALVSCHVQRKTWLVDATGTNTDLCAEWLALIAQFQQSLMAANDLLASKGVSSVELPSDGGDMSAPWVACGELQENISREQYEAKFAKVKQYLYAGDAYQINLTKRFHVAVSGNAWASYLRMRTLSPAPFGAYMNFPFGTILSNSPEQFIECYAGAVKTSPIKGTRPRDNSVLERDLAFAEELQNSAKDQAENVMIVDLLRNDFGRVCETGSIAVPELFTVESYANVHHLVSRITGRLRAGVDALDLLAASFPGGSITGAPKKRAMEIIDELEPHCRGVYCGAIGWLGFNGDMQTNIAIRTITYKDGTAYFSAGGGLVMDSDSAAEYQEIMDKAAVMFQIVGL